MSKDVMYSKLKDTLDMFAYHGETKEDIFDSLLCCACTYYIGEMGKSEVELLRYMKAKLNIE